MLAYFLVLVLLYSGYKFKVSNFSVTSLVLNIFRFYNWTNKNIIKPVRFKLLENKSGITLINVYKNGKKIKISTYNLEKNNYNDKDTIELYWRTGEHRYRTIFKGNNINENIYKTIDISKNQRNHILTATLKKFNPETKEYNEIDITKKLNEYSGPDGNFFKNRTEIINCVEYFSLNGNKMIEHTNDTVEYMDNMGEMVEL